MANRCMYYFELHRDRTDYIDSWKAGVYSTLGYVGGYTGWQNRLAHNSDRVWMQGPRGGVKIIKDRINWYGGMYGAYVTNNQKAMKQFVWVKLQARALQHT